MKKLLASLVLVSLTGCSLFTSGAVKTVLDVAQYACIIANQDLATPALIADACKIDQELAPIIELLVSEYKLKAAEAEMRAMRSAPPCK
jgi:hypothetical protein